MPDNKYSYLLPLFASCRAISYLFASMHYAIIRFGFDAPAYIAKLPHKEFETLHCIWYAKFVRRMISFLVRTPVRRNVLQIINFNIPLPAHQGCIIATCHTPWKRLLVQWCLEKKFGLLIGGGKWTNRRRIIQRQGAGLTELRELVEYLQHGGRIVVAADAFNNLNNCPVKFLGNNHNAYLFAERLAILTKVPILTIIPKLSDTAIQFTVGPRFSTDDLNSKSNTITIRILSFFEKEIERDPAILSDYV